MSYIGKTPATGNFVKLDAITTSATNTYNLLKDSVAFTPESANHMIVSLNGVIQAPSTAFSVSGSQITFIPSSGTLSSSDSIDFILVLGNVLDIGTPSDDTVSAAKLKTDSVIEAKIQDDAVTRDKINAISTSSLPAFEAKGTAGQTDGYIQLNCEQNSHGIKLKSPPHSASQSYTLTFPSTAPANNKFLQTNSSGVLSFADAGGGKVLQVLTASDSTQRQTTSTSYVTASNTLSIDITPSATSSKILILGSVVINSNQGSGHGVYGTIYRDSTNLFSSGSNNGIGCIGVYTPANTNGYVFSTSAMNFLDSPNTTSQVTYQVYVKIETGHAGNGKLNSNGLTSTLMALEIGA